MPLFHQDFQDAVDNSNEIRSAIASLFVPRSSDRLVLAPGILVLLQILFLNAGVRRVLLTDEEYYEPRHFPAWESEVTTFASLLERVRVFQPDVVIASLVSWRGRILPLGELFARIREVMPNPPILVVDYSHAGALGFPEMGQLGADVVCGDVGKWLLPAGLGNGVAFAEFVSDDLWMKAKQAFAPFFLALPAADDRPAARWLDPKHLESVAEQMRSLNLRRSDLVRRHDANMVIARRVATLLSVRSVQDSAIVWIDEGNSSSALLTTLAELRLLWHREGIGTRILCRADADLPDEIVRP